MTDTKKVETAINDLSMAIVNDDEKTAYNSLVVLIGGALIDLNRIANAVEKLVSTETVTKAEPDIPGMVSLTADEREVIEALRRGKIHVNKGPGPVTGSKAPENRPEPDAEPNLNRRDTRLCPICRHPVATTERRPDGNSRCTNGHQFKTAKAITR